MVPLAGARGVPSGALIRPAAGSRSVRTDEIRSRFLEFFRKRDHRIIAPDSLIPHNDPTLLFTGAGMNQFKEQFLGARAADFTRAATCQKCLRTADIDNVGVTRWHMTFFEMLGNFSFGDYFKREACQWAWQFMLEEMGQKSERLHVTIFEDDDETFEIWSRLVGVPEERIWRFGEEENYWPESAPSKGPYGPCGPCTEILVDTGAATVENSSPENDSSRFVEVWNLVLQQFDRQEGGAMVPLPSQNIDTGMGLERMAAIMQGAATNVDIDVMLPIVEAAADVARVPYVPGMNDEESRRLRRIAEHVRAVSFCIADGALPDRYGRGYVVRKLIRRAALDGRHLGIAEPFLSGLVPVVEKTMGGAYPEIGQRKETICSILDGEEQRFAGALDPDSPGMRKFEEFVAQRQPDKGRAKAATYDATRDLERFMFECYDTFGLPLEYMQQRLADARLLYDREAFEEAMERRRAQSRAGSGFGGEAIVFKREALSPEALDRLHRENLTTAFVASSATPGSGRPTRAPTSRCCWTARRSTPARAARSAMSARSRVPTARPPSPIPSSTTSLSSTWRRSSGAASSGASASVPPSIPTAASPPPATTPPRTSCSGPCARPSASTSTRRGRKCRRRGCGSTSRTRRPCRSRSGGRWRPL